MPSARLIEVVHPLARRFDTACHTTLRRASSKRIEIPVAAKIKKFYFECKRCRQHISHEQSAKPYYDIEAPLSKSSGTPSASRCDNGCKFVTAISCGGPPR